MRCVAHAVRTGRSEREGPCDTDRAGDVQFTFWGRESIACAVKVCATYWCNRVCAPQFPAATPPVA